MQRPDRSATSPGDIAVELREVDKIFFQRQRSERFRDVLKNLFRPTIREIHALRGVNLAIRHGEIVAYAGPNGAGKSTTVKLLSSVLAPTAGSVRCLGMDPLKERVRYVRRIGVVFGQRTELWWDQPVAASFEWKRVVWEIPRPRYEAMLGFVKELLGIGEFFHTLARQLSLGQKMRADIAPPLRRASRESASPAATATATTSPSTPPAPRSPPCCSRRRRRPRSTTWRPTAPASTT